MKISIVLLLTAFVLVGFIGDVSCNGKKDPAENSETSPQDEPKSDKSEDQKKGTKPKTEAKAPEVEKKDKNGTTPPKSQKPQAPTAKPKSKETEPKNKPAVEKPKSKPAVEKPKSKPTVEKPKSKPTVEKPKSKPVSKANQNPKQTNPPKSPTKVLPNKNNNNLVTPPKELTEPLDVDGLLSSIAELPTDVARAAQTNLQNLSNLLGDYTDLQKYFRGLSILLGNRNLIDQILNNFQGLPFLTSLDSLTPIINAFFKLKGTLLKTGGQIIQSVGDVVDTGFGLLKNKYAMVTSITDPVGNSIPGVNLIYKPTRTLSGVLLNTASQLAGDNIQTIGEAFEDAGESFLNDRDRKRLARRRL
ncbi:hypothetical protein PGB90_001278 [Kerria lacca]